MNAQNPPTWQAGSQTTLRPSPELSSQVLTQAFFWMFAGLLVTAGVAFVVQGNTSLLRFAGQNWFLLFIGQAALAIGIQALIRKLNPVTALGLFFIYAATLGLSIGLIVSFYTKTSVATAFLSAASIFGAAALYGYTTKRPLVKVQQFIGIALFGWLIALVVNIVIPSSPLAIGFSLFTVGLFTVLTALNVKQISRGDYIEIAGTAERAAVLGAVHLYISFINIFISLLHLMGDRD